MPEYRYRIVNVFTDDGALTGNPLCVFEDARDIDDATMQALARQFNLSETAFVLPSQKATARVRIFTPAYEMPFAGHPTLGTAFSVNALHQAKGELTLEMKAGVIPVRCIDARRERWQLKANAPTWRDYAESESDLLAMLGLASTDRGGPIRWVNAGNEQLMVPIASAQAVHRARPDAVAMLRVGPAPGKLKALLFAPTSGSELVARFFFGQDSSVAEDPATGSACANLGGWYLSQHAKLPLQRTILQGEHVGRPSRLYLDIDVDSNTFVAGDVVELGRGTVTL
jgi:trans-2,3-dihydro-3-hydroxyanthranilate isomerase